ncbi:MAG: winged helix-turn-helix domain-containing protein [Actinomycetota bacterium]
MSVTVDERDQASWTFLTNHAHVMVALSRDPDLRQRDLADAVGITPGAIQRILDDLERAGYVERERIGRRNRYQIDGKRSLRHPLESDRTIGEIIDQLNS